jgi:hypothetical protein
LPLRFLKILTKESGHRHDNCDEQKGIAAPSASRLRAAVFIITEPLLPTCIAAEPATVLPKPMAASRNSTSSASETRRI